MRAVPEKSNLVVVGAFNPAILNPAWIAKNALGIVAGEDIEVEMLAPVMGGINLLPPRYKFEGISYVVTPQRLAFSFDGLDEAGASKVVRTVRKIFELLPHTPISGVGFNFGFESDASSAKLDALLAKEVALLDAVPDQNGELVGQGWSNTLRVGDDLFAVACKQEGGITFIDVNAHRNTNDVASLVAFLANDGLFVEHFAFAKSLAVVLNEGDLE